MSDEVLAEISEDQNKLFTKQENQVTESSANFVSCQLYS